MRTENLPFENFTNASYFFWGVHSHTHTNTQTLPISKWRWKYSRKAIKRYNRVSESLSKLKRNSEHSHGFAYILSPIHSISFRKAKSFDCPCQWHMCARKVYTCFCMRLFYGIIMCIVFVDRSCSCVCQCPHTHTHIRTNFFLFYFFLITFWMLFVFVVVVRLLLTCRRGCFWVRSAIFSAICVSATKKAVDVIPKSLYKFCFIKRGDRKPTEKKRPGNRLMEWAGGDGTKTFSYKLVTGAA